jgi:hypothetical protein
MHTNLHRRWSNKKSSSTSRPLRARRIQSRPALTVSRSKTPTIRRNLLLNNVTIYLALSTLNALIHIIRILSHHRGVRDVTFIAAIWRDEDVEPARNHKPAEEEEEYDVAYAEAHDVQRIGLAS